jgi:hypothetical protein
MKRPFPTTVNQRVSGSSPEGGAEKNAVKKATF